MKTRTVAELLFSDLDFGTEQFGFLPRTVSHPDDEDRAYQRFIRQTTGSKAFQVMDGVIYEVLNQS